MDSTHTDLPEWVSPTQLASALGVTASTVRRYEEAGKIPRAKLTLGGHRRWRRADVEDLMNSRRSQQKAGA